MVPRVVNSRLHQRKSIPSSSLRVSSTSLTATKHRLAPTFSASQIISHQSLVTGHQSLSLFLSHASGLFCTLQILNSFVFMQFRTLSPKHRGVGTPNFILRGSK